MKGLGTVPGASMHCDSLALCMMYEASFLNVLVGFRMSMSRQVVDGSGEDEVRADH